MTNDPKPVGYTYEEARKVLENLEFVCAKTSGGSHRVWRKKLPSGDSVRVGLVDSGSGTLPREYIQDMIAALLQHGLLPPEDIEG
jgi:hypothetical protein